MTPAVAASSSEGQDGLALGRSHAAAAAGPRGWPSLGDQAEREFYFDVALIFNEGCRGVAARNSERIPIGVIPTSLDSAAWEHVVTGFIFALPAAHIVTNVSLSRLRS